MGTPEKFGIRKIGMRERQRTSRQNWAREDAVAFQARRMSELPRQREREHAMHRRGGGLILQGYRLDLSRRVGVREVGKRKN